MTEKDVKEKETKNEELDLNLLSPEEHKIVDKYIAITKYVIQNLEPIFPKLSEITDFSAISSIINSIVIQVQKEIERSEQKNQNHFYNGESNKKNDTNPVNLESLLNSLTFRTAKKNGDLKYAIIDIELAKKLPQAFEVNGKRFSVKTYENEKKAIIYENIKKDQKQKNAQKQ